MGKARGWLEQRVRTNIRREAQGILLAGLIASPHWARLACRIVRTDHFDQDMRFTWLVLTDKRRRRLKEELSGEPRGPGSRMLHRLAQHPIDDLDRADVQLLAWAIRLQPGATEVCPICHYFDLADLAEQALRDLERAPDPADRALAIVKSAIRPSARTFLRQ